jgi:CelD/BcsL family acetyltransferase involved in cellulose biosynthesis
VTPELRLEVVRAPEALAAMAGTWDALLAVQPRPSPYILSAWMAVWWQHRSQPGDELACITGWRGSALVAALPAMVHVSRRGRVASLVGRGDALLADALLAPGEDDATTSRLLATLADGVDYGDLYGFPDQGSLARAAASSHMRVLARTRTSSLTMPAGWDAVYEARTSGKRRNDDRRRERQLAGLGTVEFRLAATADEVDGVLDDCFRLHRIDWAGRADRSSLATEDGRAFQREALRRVAAEDRFRIGLLALDGRPIAFRSWFTIGSTAILHRSAFDRSLDRYSPGLIALRRTLATLSDSGVERVEFLDGDEQYKFDLADTVAMQCEAIGLARTTRGRLEVNARLAQIRAREIAKRSTLLRRIRTAVAARRPR